MGHVARTVTLQVTPEDSDRLAVARQLGRLSLAVRAMSDGSAETMAHGAASTYSKDVSSVLTDPAGKTVRVIQGEQHNDVTFR
jgi:pilus assembly protein CpaB